MKAAMVLALPLWMTAGHACEGIGEPFVNLRVTPTELAQIDRTLTVAVHDNGCVHIHRPAHYRDPGSYRLALATGERETLQSALLAPSMLDFDVNAVRVQIDALAAGRGVGDKPELFAVHDADRYELEIGAADAPVIVWHGLYPYAEHYPEVQPLQELRALVDQLQQLARRADAQRVSEVQP
jgi:hypothetical protein